MYKLAGTLTDVLQAEPRRCCSLKIIKILRPRAPVPRPGTPRVMLPLPPDWVCLSVKLEREGSPPLAPPPPPPPAQKPVFGGAGFNKGERSVAESVPPPRQKKKQLMKVQVLFCRYVNSTDTVSDTYMNAYSSHRRRCIVVRMIRAYDCLEK